MSQIKFLLLSCLFILQLCESNSTQKWGRLITFWMTPLYREPSKYVQKDPILCQTGFVANARHDYLGEPAQIPFSDVYIKEEFCNIDNREREKQFSVGSGKNPYILQFGKFFFWKGRTNPLLSSYDVLVTTEFALEIIFCVGILFLYILTFKWSFFTLWCFW